MALYTNYLLVSLHAEFRKRLAKDTDDPRSSDPNYIVSYHDIMGGLLGKHVRTFTLIVVFFALVGLSTVQTIATSSNFYILENSICKRSWCLIWGGPFSLVAFVPSFRHYRLLSVLGILTSTYTSWFMCISAAIEGPIDDVVYDTPRNKAKFFPGLVSLMFVFGGHATNTECR
jgi:auxin influx carrier (AUX1 LAX family)